MSLGKYILVADDDALVAETVSDVLEAEGYACHCVNSGAAVLEEVRRKRPDLVVIDRMMPGSSGDEVVRQLRANPETANIPVIMLSGKAEETDELVGLALGADDYIPKPFSNRRLSARVTAVLRRTEGPGESGAGVAQQAQTAAPEQAASGSAMLDPAQHRIWIDDEAFNLSGPAYRLFTALVAARGFVIDTSRLSKALLGAASPAARAEVKAQMDELMQRLGRAGEVVQYVEGAGYAFCPPPGSVIRI